MRNNPVANSSSRLKQIQKLHSTENSNISFAMGHRLNCAPTDF